MTDILKSQVFMSGTKFVVTEDSVDGTFGPGTLGMIAYVKGRDQDFGNVLYYRAVIIRRGKSGKERIDMCDLSTPVFELPGDAIKSVMPDEKRRYYVHIEPIPLPDSIMEFSEVDFLAYAFAYSRWVRKLNTRAKHVNAWPNDSSDILNSFVRMDEFHEEDPTYARNSFANSDMRSEFVRKIRVMEATLVRCSLSYMSKVAEIEKRAAHGILTCGIDVAEKSILEETCKHYSRKVDSLLSLTSIHGKQVKSMNKKDLMSLASGISWS